MQGSICLYLFCCNRYKRFRRFYSRLKDLKLGQRAIPPPLMHKQSKCISKQIIGPPSIESNVIIISGFVKNKSGAVLFEIN